MKPIKYAHTHTHTLTARAAATNEKGKTIETTLKINKCLDAVSLLLMLGVVPASFDCSFVRCSHSVKTVDRGRDEVWFGKCSAFF